MCSHIFYNTLLCFAKLKAFFTRLSYRDFHHFCHGGVVIFSIILTIATWPMMSQYSLKAQMCYYAGYVWGILFSYMVMENYLQHIFRNVFGVLLTAIGLPAFIGMVTWKLWVTAMDSRLVIIWIGLIVACMFVWLFRQCYMPYGNIVRRDGLLSVMQFWKMRVQRDIRLGKALKQWRKGTENLDYAFSWLLPELWWGYSKEERIEYIQKTLTYELDSLKLEKSIHIFPQSLNRIPVLDFRCEIDFQDDAVIWEKDAVVLFSPQRILTEILGILNIYQWYETLSDAEQDTVRKEYEALRSLDYIDLTESELLEELLYQQLNGANWSLGYDILTHDYARTKADWYCGF